MRIGEISSVYPLFQHQRSKLFTAAEAQLTSITVRATAALKLIIPTACTRSNVRKSLQIIPAPLWRKRGCCLLGCLLRKAPDSSQIFAGWRPQERRFANEHPLVKLTDVRCKPSCLLHVAGPRQAGLLSSSEIFYYAKPDELSNTSTANELSCTYLGSKRCSPSSWGMFPRRFDAILREIARQQLALKP